MNILAQTAEAIGNEVTQVAWYQNQTILGLIGVLLGIIVAVFLGRLIGKSCKVPELSGRIGLIIWCLILSAIVISIKPLKFGVDLRGGVTIIGQMNEQKLDPGETALTINDIIPRLKERIDPSGVREIVIRGLGRDKMEVIIPDVEKEEAERIWQRLVSAGQLFFRIVADENLHSSLIAKARETIGDRRDRVIGDKPDDLFPEGRPIGEWYPLARMQPTEGEPPNAVRAFKFMPEPKHLLRNKQTGELIDLRAINLVGDYDEKRQGFADYCRANQIKDVEILMVYPPRERQNVEGGLIKNVRKSFGQNAEPNIAFKMKPEGAKRLFSLTQRNKPNNGLYSLLGIVLDGKLQSAPRINQPIRTDGVIEGSFTDEEIQDYVTILNSGKLDVALRKNWISMDQILSTLGEELKSKGIFALGLSLSIVLVFMIVYYRFCGIVACLALAMNLVFTLAIILLINVNLTLTGLAGLVLTIGMSVDANVLIFERIREELERGTALRMAIRNGFDRATTTIIDANLTTLITAVILYVIGTDQLRSFSVTLIVGILMCMFTSIVVSRVFFNIAERMRWISKLSMAKIVGNNMIDFISKRHIASVVSFLVIGIGLAGFVYRGSGILDTDLAGGSTARVEFNSDIQRSDVETALADSDYQYEGDRIRYSITQMKDNPRAFKIDSSLPVVDRSDAEAEDQLKLDEIIGDVFTGKLVMLNLQYDPNSIKVTRKDGTEVEITPAIPMIPMVPMVPADDGAMNDRRISSWSALPSSRLISTALSTALLTAPHQQEPPTTNQDNTQDPAAAEKNTTGRESYTATFPLKFRHAIVGESVKGYLVTAANELKDIPLDEDAITLTGVDAEDLQDRSTDWNVQMEVFEPTDAHRVVEQVQTTMSTKPYFASSSGVGGQIALQTQGTAMVAMIASLVGIIAYVWIRFQNVAFGLAAIVALVHDVLVVLGAIAVSYWLSGFLGFLLVEPFRISLTVVAALLTIIGYSLNDTIVVFDRIREVRGKRTDVTAEMINRSISQTLSRTILTSLTTFIVVFILYLLGGDSIHTFAFALVIGVIVGTYSSIFVASPTLLWLMNRGNATSPAGVKASAAKN